jgi:hypothetical protein
MLDPDHPWAPSAEIVDDPKGGLVKAEEAEARIKKLEEENESLLEQLNRVRATNEDYAAWYGQDKSRLRAADELADAVERRERAHGAKQVMGTGRALLQALTAYREVSNKTSDGGTGSSNAQNPDGESEDRAFLSASAADPPDRASTPPPSVDIPDEAVEARDTSTCPYCPTEEPCADWRHWYDTAAYMTKALKNVVEREKEHESIIRAQVLDEVRARVEAKRRTTGYFDTPADHRAVRTHNRAIDDALAAVQEADSK